MAALAKTTQEQLRSISDPKASVRLNWSRYEYCKMRGHVIYCEKAKRNEEYWAGGGLQWLPDDREDMEVNQLAKAIEINEIFDAVNTAVGYQINNRLDISFRPRGEGATEQVATTLSKVAMQVADATKLRWVETEVFRDGMIQQRGFYEIRMKFDENLKGEIYICALDPLDVIPDPDAKSYDPDDWADVIVTRWLTLDEVEVMYGAKARAAIEDRGYPVNERDFGVSANEVMRNKFGEEEWGAGSQFDAYYTEGGVTRVRIIDRQFWMMKMSNCIVYKTGEIRNVDGATPEEMAAHRASGCITMKRMQRRVRWLVTTMDVELFNDWSPYDHFTIVPYFPYFRRGLTRGYVDNAIGPQDLLNKVTSKIVQIVSATANAGWVVEEESLTNMSVEDLQANGARNGIVLEYAKGTTDKPERIQPAAAPASFFELAAFASGKIKMTTGNPDSLKGDRGKQQSGLAVQAQQFGDQITMAGPLDSLSRTRHILADRLLWCFQHFMDEPQLMRIAHTDQETGAKSTVELPLNWPQDDGTLLNDLTIGKYDVVITEQPAQVTFENSQYNQAMEMREKGINIPDPVIIRYSSLSDKAEVIGQMQQKSDPKAESEAALNQARATLAQAQALEKTIQALFSSIRTAQIVEAVPQTAGIADSIARAAGFKDAGGGAGGPIPTPAAGTPPPPLPPTNTNPTTTGSAARGAEAGIEGGQPGGQ